MVETIHVEPAVTTEAVIQADLGGVTIALTGVVTRDELDGWLDVRMRAIHRQRARQELVEAQIDLLAHRDTLAQCPERETALRRQKAEERAHLVAQIDARNSTGRTERPRSVQQQQQIQALDLQLDADLKKLADDKAKIEAEIPRLEARLARARAIVDGKDRSEILDELIRRKMPEAAD